MYNFKIPNEGESETQEALSQFRDKFKHFWQRQMSYIHSWKEKQFYDHAIELFLINSWSIFHTAEAGSETH